MLQKQIAEARSLLEKWLIKLLFKTIELSYSKIINDHFLSLFYLIPFYFILALCDNQ